MLLAGQAGRGERLRVAGFSSAGNQHAGRKLCCLLDYSGLEPEP